MLTKKATTFSLKDVQLLNTLESKFPRFSKNFISKVAAKVEEDKPVITKFDLKGEMEKHPGSLFVKALAIIADEMNDNGDFFSTSELKKSYHTFVGVPLFCNHENDNVEEARGKVVHAEWDDARNGVVIIGRVDAKAYPKLARGISEGYITGVSMGCNVSHSTCSICGNKAETEADYCSHIKESKGRKINGKLVYEDNFGIKFIELSFVVDPACETCHVEEIFDIDDFKKGIAAMTNQVRALKKVASSTKVAGKTEIDKLNQAEQLLHDVAKTMLDQRNQLDLNFATDIVEVLAKLQETKDELVDMGYGSLQSPGETPEEAPVPAPEAAFPEATGYEQTPAGEVGSVTMPTAAENQLKKLVVSSLTNKWRKEI